MVVKECLPVDGAEDEFLSVMNDHAGILKKTERGLGCKGKEGDVRGLAATGHAMGIKEGGSWREGSINW